MELLIVVACLGFLAAGSVVGYTPYARRTTVTLNDPDLRKDHSHE